MCKDKSLRMLQELKTESKPNRINKNKTLKDIRKESFGADKKNLDI